MWLPHTIGKEYMEPSWTELAQFIQRIRRGENQEEQESKVKTIDPIIQIQQNQAISFAPFFKTPASIKGWMSKIRRYSKERLRPKTETNYWSYINDRKKRWKYTESHTNCVYFGEKRRSPFWNFKTRPNGLKVWMIKKNDERE